MAETEKPWQPAIEAAISKAGGKTQLKDRLNERGWEISSHNVIAQWVANGVPSKYCPDIEDMFGIPCELLCPEVRWGLVRDRRLKKGRKPRKVGAVDAGHNARPQ